MTKYLPAKFLQRAAAVVFAYVIANVLWLTTLAPSFA